jgi:acetylornithine deacetylase/succinyl-diaminopimelate desuccinylase-like protein
MTDITARLDACVPQARADLADLVAIASISSMPEHGVDVVASATWIIGKLKEIGAHDAYIVREGGQPAVIAHFPAPVGQPTICLYSHHDVQPTGDKAGWTTQPFTATERDGRLYGRGCADDKGGVTAHLLALRAWDGKPPIGVTLFLEGEEEVGSPSVEAIIERHHDALLADAYLILDAGNWEVGRPAFTSTLRGVVDCVVTVRTLKYGVHSGEFGGVVPDALTALCRLLATLHDERGNVAVAGIKTTPAPDLVRPLDRLEVESGKLPGTSWIGDGSVVQRLWNSPAISVIALDTTRIADASNTLIPAASAKVSLRVPPDNDAARALEALKEHLLTHAPWGAEVTVTDGSVGQPSLATLEGPVYDAMVASVREAWGVDPVQSGEGGSIPLVADLEHAFPGAAVLCTAVGDPSSRQHGLDESLDLGDWRNAALVEALLMGRLARN